MDPIHWMPGYLRNFTDTKALGKFPKYSGIWERYLRVVYFEDFINFPNAWIFRKFPKSLGIWEIPQIPIGIWGRYIFKILEISQMPGTWDTQAFSKFSRYPGIWEISQIPRHLGNSPNSFRYFTASIVLRFWCYKVFNCTPPFCPS